jgi:SAM-dependent methyltransferase
MTDWVPYYQTRYQFDPRRFRVWQLICEWLQQEVPADGYVLELGAGYCDFINNIQAARKVAVDIVETVRQAAASTVEAHVSSCTHLDFVTTDSVDVVFASNLFEHLSPPQVEETLCEVRRVLKPGGKLLVIQPNFRYSYRDYFDDYTHVTIFTDRSLADVIACAGLEIVKAIPRFIPFSLKSWLPVIPYVIQSYLRSPGARLRDKCLLWPVSQECKKVHHVEWQDCERCIPAYNEEEGIAAAVTDFLDTGPVDEMLVVSNNSKRQHGRTSRRGGGTRGYRDDSRLWRGAGPGSGEAAGEFVILAEPDGTFWPRHHETSRVFSGF